MQRRTVKYLVLTLLASVWSGAIPASFGSTPSVWTFDPALPAQPCPAMPDCGVWLEFRSAHPWPYQAFALQERNGEAVVIISEPPPSVTHGRMADALDALFGKDLLEFAYDRWPTGVDGWLEDAVIRVRLRDGGRTTVIGGGLERWEAPQAVVDRLRVLARLFYGTADGFWLDRAGEREARPGPIPELKAGISDVAGWLADPRGDWTPVGRTVRRKTAELLASNAPEVFARDGGLVALVVPRAVKAGDLAPHFRRFAVESDLLVGAADLRSGGMLLLGRARQVPPGVLPPLRLETFLAFAQDPTEHLFQSYERQRIFAGRIRSGKYAGWDWAPILLSAQLDDSDFGTLLNLADQILKSWSQHGEVDYLAFQYPSPETYPFGAQPASDYFGRKYGSTSLLFNWNTEGLATITTVNGRDILTAERTGALPILYRPAGANAAQAARITGRDAVQTDADERARDAREYFAARGDPILVRVVQHVLLFQAAVSLLATEERPSKESRARSDRVGAVLVRHAAAWLRSVLRGETGGRELSAALTVFMRDSGLDEVQMAKVLASPQGVERDLEREYQRLRTFDADQRWRPEYLRKVEGERGRLFRVACDAVGGTMQPAPGGERCQWRAGAGSGRDVFAAFEAFTRAVERIFSEYNASVVSHNQRVRDFNALQENYLRAQEFAGRLSRVDTGVDLDVVLRSVLDSEAGIPGTNSIRTPSVVLSRNRVDVGAIGGHNIDLTPRRMAIAPEIRSSAAGPELGLLALEPPRPEADTLGIRRKGSLLEEMRAASLRADAGSERWARLEGLAKSSDCDIIAEHGEGGLIYLYRGGPQPTRETIFGKSGLLDALANSGTRSIVRFENFDLETVEYIARTTALAAADGGKGWDDKLKGLGALFGDRLSGGVGISVAVVENGKDPQILRILGETGTLSLRQPVSWKGLVTAAEPESWTALSDRPPGEARSAVIVRFGAPGPSQATLGIGLRGRAAAQSGILVRLLAIVREWIARQTGRRALVDGVAELRAAIRAKLNQGEVEFYYQRNKGKIRVAEAGTATVGAGAE